MACDVFVINRPIFNMWLQAGVVTFSTNIIKGGVGKFALKQPIFLVSIYSRPTERLHTDTSTFSHLRSTLSILPRYVHEELF
jgi:hypothetical protein